MAKVTNPTKFTLSCPPLKKNIRGHCSVTCTNEQARRVSTTVFKVELDEEATPRRTTSLRGSNQVEQTEKPDAETRGGAVWFATGIKKQ